MCTHTLAEEHYKWNQLCVLCASAFSFLLFATSGGSHLGLTVQVCRTVDNRFTCQSTKNPDTAEISNAEKWVLYLSAFDFSATIDLAMMTKRGSPHRVDCTDCPTCLLAIGLI